MIADELLAFERRRFALPARDVDVEELRVRVEVGLEDRLVLRPEAGQAVGDRARDVFGEHGIEIDVRVPHRVLIAEGAVDTRRHVERIHVHGAVDVAGRVAENLRVARRLQPRRQERMLRLEADEHDRVGAVQGDGEARLHRHGVDVLDPGREAFDFDEVAADVLRDVGEIGNRRDDAELVGAVRGRELRE